MQRYGFVTTKTWLKNLAPRCRWVLFKTIVLLFLLITCIFTILMFLPILITYVENYIVIIQSKIAQMLYSMMKSLNSLHDFRSFSITFSQLYSTHSLHASYNIYYYLYITRTIHASDNIHNTDVATLAHTECLNKNIHIFHKWPLWPL